MLLDGHWQDDQPAARSDARGAFVRPQSPFRDQVTADGSSCFPAEPGRYHLYVALSCPWAHRALIGRALKGLQGAITVSVVDPVMSGEGWAFSDRPGCSPDTVNGATHLHEIYTRADPRHTGRVTVPVLWDKVTGRIVSNESAEILRMLDGAFDAFAAPDAPRFRPDDLVPQIDALNSVIYGAVNNGIYKTGFATTQRAYDRAVRELFAALDTLEARLARQPFLCGTRATEADWRLFPTLARFDVAYHGAFRCNLRRLADYPALSAYAQQLYEVPGIRETVNFEHIRLHYWTIPAVNPLRIVPIGPRLDVVQPFATPQAP